MLSASIRSLGTALFHMARTIPCFAHTIVEKILPEIWSTRSFCLRAKHDVIRSIWRKISTSPLITANNAVCRLYNSEEKSCWNLTGWGGKGPSRSDSHMIFLFRTVSTRCSVVGPIMRFGRVYFYMAWITSSSVPSVVLKNPNEIWWVEER